MKIVLVYFLLLQIAVIKTKYYVENRQGVDLKSVGPKVRPGKKYNEIKASKKSKVKLQIQFK